MLNLKSLMNLDAAAAFDINATCGTDSRWTHCRPAAWFRLYAGVKIQNQPQQKEMSSGWKRHKNILAAKGAMKPTLSAFAQPEYKLPGLQKKRPFYQQVISGYESTGLIVDAGAGISTTFSRPYWPKVILPDTSARIHWAPSWTITQETFGLSISVPIFNGGSLKTGYERSRFNLSSAKLQKEQDDQKLKQDIYQAYNAALVALGKSWMPVKIGGNLWAHIFSFARKRYDVGIPSTFDLITTQNNLLRAKLENSINRFDYVFKNESAGIL